MRDEIKFMLLGILVLILFVSVFAMFRFRMLQRSFTETQSPKIESKMRLYIAIMTILMVALAVMTIYVIMFYKIREKGL